MSRPASRTGVESYNHNRFEDIFQTFNAAANTLFRHPATSAPASSSSTSRPLLGAPFTTLPRGRSEAARTHPSGKASYSLRSMKLGDVARAMQIAADNFRGEVALVARSYLWHFGQRAGLGSLGAMWTRRHVDVTIRGETAIRIDLLSSFVHDKDVAWLDLGGRETPDVAMAVAAFRQWPRRHRLLVVRVDEQHMPRLLDAGFSPAGELPESNAGPVYLFAARDRIADGSGPRLKLRFSGRRRLESSCDFGVVEREGTVLGLTGIYRTSFWRDVAWGAWGAVDRASARRDAVFEILRLTEARARAEGARWFCLETSDGEKYRHARRIYELNGLELLMTVPDFYRLSDGTSEALMIYGKPLAEPAVASPMSRPEQEDRLAA